MERIKLLKKLAKVNRLIIFHGPELHINELEKATRLKNEIKQKLGVSDEENIFQSL